MAESKRWQLLLLTTRTLGSEVNSQASGVLDCWSDVQ